MKRTVATAFALVCLATAARADFWASPGELRGKKMIASGQCMMQDLRNAITPHFLAEHQDFTATFPFDGIAVVAQLDSKWCVEQGLDAGGDFTLENMVWTSRPIPYAAVQDVVTDLKRVSWGHLTDNFLLCGMGDGSDGLFPVDLTRDSDWAAVENNAALAARVCREANMKGFMLDTEQYSRYVNKPNAYPLGKDTPELLRRRGQQWIKAVQTEYPGITIMTTFAWSPDLDMPGFLTGVKEFLNGVLEGIEEPAQIINAHENTFYYGRAAGSRYTKRGYPGGSLEVVGVETDITGKRASRYNNHNPAMSRIVV